MRKLTNEIRLDEYGDLDEVVVGRFPGPRRKAGSICFHLERMSCGHWWMRVTIPGGGDIDVNMWVKKGKICARADRYV